MVHVRYLYLQLQREKQQAVGAADYYVFICFIVIAAIAPFAMHLIYILQQTAG